MADKLENGTVEMMVVLSVGWKVEKRELLSVRMTVGKWG